MRYHFFLRYGWFFHNLGKKLSELLCTRLQIQKIALAVLIFSEGFDLNQCLTCWQIWLARHQDLLLFQQELIIRHLTVRHYQKSSDSLDLAPLSSQPDSTFSTLSKSTWNFKNKICPYLLINFIRERSLQGLELK